jgi:hypothetical protein
LGYGKFCLAFLVVDLYNAKRDQNELPGATIESFSGVRPNIAWVGAAGIIAAGAALSFALPQHAAGVEPVRGNTLTAEVEWKPLMSAEGLFSVSMPGVATETTRTQENPTGRPPIQVHNFEVNQPSSWYAVQYLRFEDTHIDRSATIQRVLESSRDGMMRNMAAQGGTLIDSRVIEHGAWPGLEVSFRVPTGRDTVRGDARIILAGRTLYTLLGIGTPQSDWSRFVESFTIERASDTFRLPNRQ